MGIKTWKNGSKYQGEWRDDEMNGFGTYTFKSGKNYTGDFRDGNFDGKG